MPVFPRIVRRGSSPPACDGSRDVVALVARCNEDDENGAHHEEPTTVRSSEGEEEDFVFVISKLVAKRCTLLERLLFADHDDDNDDHDKDEAKHPLPNGNHDDDEDKMASSSISLEHGKHFDDALGGGTSGYLSQSERLSSPTLPPKSANDVTLSFPYTVPITSSRFAPIDLHLFTAYADLPDRTPWTRLGKPNGTFHEAIAAMSTSEHLFVGALLSKHVLLQLQKLKDGRLASEMQRRGGATFRSVIDDGSSERPNTSSTFQQHSHQRPNLTWVFRLLALAEFLGCEDLMHLLSAVSACIMVDAKRREPPAQQRPDLDTACHWGRLLLFQNAWDPSVAQGDDVLPRQTKLPQERNEAGSDDADERLKLSAARKKKKQKVPNPDEQQQHQHQNGAKEDDNDDDTRILKRRDYLSVETQYSIIESHLIVLTQKHVPMLMAKVDDA